MLHLELCSSLMFSHRLNVFNLIIFTLLTGKHVMNHPLTLFLCQIVLILPLSLFSCLTRCTMLVAHGLVLGGFTVRVQQRFWKAQMDWSLFIRMRRGSRLMTSPVSPHCHFTEICKALLDDWSQQSTINVHIQI